MKTATSKSEEGGGDSGHPLSSNKYSEPMYPTGYEGSTIFLRLPRLSAASHAMMGYDKNKMNTASCRNRSTVRDVGNNAVTTMKTATSKSEEGGGDSGHPLSSNKYSEPMYPTGYEGSTIFLRLPRLSAASHAMMGYDGQMGSLDGLNRINPSSPSWIDKVDAGQRSRG